MGQRKKKQPWRNASRIWRQKNQQTRSGKPAYQLDGKILVFFQSAHHLGSGYSIIGFSYSAKLDDGFFCATSFALLEMDSNIEMRILQLIWKAIGWKDAKKVTDLYAQSLLVILQGINRAGIPATILCWYDKRCQSCGLWDHRRWWLQAHPLQILSENPQPRKES